MFLSIAVPVLAILIAWMDNRRSAQETNRKMAGLQRDIGEVKISIANLRAELYEKFQLRREHV